MVESDNAGCTSEAEKIKVLRPTLFTKLKDNPKQMRKQQVTWQLSAEVIKAIEKKAKKEKKAKQVVANETLLADKELMKYAE